MVKGHFIIHPKKDENTTRNTDGKARNINEGIDRIPCQVAKSDFQIVSEHE